jgi:hypothetical protein
LEKVGISENFWLEILWEKNCAKMHTMREGHMTGTERRRGTGNIAEKQSERVKKK